MVALCTAVKITGSPAGQVYPECFGYNDECSKFFNSLGPLPKITVALLVWTLFL